MKKTMKKTMKKISALFIVTFMLISMFGTVAVTAEPAPKEKTLNFVGSGSFIISKPDEVVAAGNWSVTTEVGSAGTDSYFQYDLSSLPENEVITKATWKALYTEGQKYIEVRGFNATENLGNFTKSYNALLNAGYNNPYTIRSAGLISKDELTTVSATDGTSTKNMQQWNIDMTTAVQNAVANNQQYLSFVVNATAGYAYGYIPRYWSPQPILVVETQKVASLNLVGLTDGKINTYNSVGFDIEAEAIEGEENFKSVVLTITDENNETKTYDEPVVNGNRYKWSFSGGLSEGTYTAVVTATDAAGGVLTANAIIEVEPSVQSVISKPDLLAKSGATDVNFSINSDPSYFQHELPQIPDNAAITSAKWYVMKGTFNTNYPNGSFVFSKINTQEKLTGSFNNSNVAGYAELTASESFAVSGVISNTIVNTTLNGYTNDFAEVDLTNAVKTAYAANEKYFGYMVKLTDGYYTVSNYATQYRPFMVITYDIGYVEPVKPVENHVLTVVDGTASASVTVNEGSAVLIIAAYNGNQLLDVVMDDTIEDSQLTTSLTNSTPGVTFKSFVWESMDTLTPLLLAK